LVKASATSNAARVKISVAKARLNAGGLQTLRETR
jgi:hypothetical protein